MSLCLILYLFVLIFYFSVVLDLIYVGVWKHMLVFGNTCWCLETHVCVVVFLSFDFKFVIIHSATDVLMSFTSSLSHLLPI